MKPGERQKPSKKGNPSWAKGTPRSLEEIDNERYRALALRPGRGPLSWRHMRAAEARRQGQGEPPLPLDPLLGAREEIERNAGVPRARICAEACREEEIEP